MDVLANTKQKPMKEYDTPNRDCSNIFPDLLKTHTPMFPYLQSHVRTFCESKIAERTSAQCQASKKTFYWAVYSAHEKLKREKTQ